MPLSSQKEPFVSADREVAPARALALPYEAHALPTALEEIAPAEVLERWCAVDRSAQTPQLVAMPDDGGGFAGWRGAALLTARPGASYVKIVDAVGDVPAVAAAVLEHARARGLVQVKWEGWTVTPAQAADAGFTPLRAPDSTSEDTGGLDSGYVCWLDGAAVAEPPYYRQSTHFTCAAVAALTAQVHVGAIATTDVNRAAELTLWRRATNFAACEPVGLGVALQRTWPGTEIIICLDTDQPVLLESYSEPEQQWRAMLQHASRAEAMEAEVPIDARRLEIPALRAALDAGEHVLMVLSLATMLGYEVPHWVLCHGTVPGAVVIEDPWIDEPRGETWVDTHLLPVPDASLKAMSALGEDGYRGAVRIGSPG